MKQTNYLKKKRLKQTQKKFIIGKTHKIETRENKGKNDFIPITLINCHFIPLKLKMVIFSPLTLIVVAQKMA